MLFAITTTAIEVIAPHSMDAYYKFSASKFVSSATAIYIRPVGTANPWLVLNGTGNSSDKLLVPGGTQLEAYTDAGTADLVILKTCCSASDIPQ
jgi:hypothetical protein